MKTNWLMLILVGLCYGVIYYFVFLFMIKKFNLKTPGRDENEEETKLYTKVDFQTKNENEVNKDKLADPEGEMEQTAERILKALGGEKNIVSVDACITRLRVEVKNKSKVDKDELKELGAAGVMEVGNGIQAIFGANADRYKNAINDILEIS